MTEKIDFIGIGAPRCGTSWLANILRAHPQICVSEPKEVRYFNKYEMPIGNLKGKENLNFMNDLSWYLQRFAHVQPGQIIGEISPVYLSDEHAPARIKECYPDIKLLVCVRHPVDRALSFFLLHKGNKHIAEDITFAQALKQESVYVETGLYARNIERYLKYFKKEQMQLIVFEQLIAQPEKVFKHIFKFLEVDPDGIENFSGFDKNASFKSRSMRLHKFSVRVQQFLIDMGMSHFLQLLRRWGAYDFWRLVNKTPTKKGQVADDAKSYFMDILEEDIKKLSETFDIDFKRIWE